ncbi:UdgX family uracil-DNA binding protein [Acidisoma silvae]|uniref:Type-4 uracil-DNA glycosylase n=1 Tax=Acidisoma silvae TaxID=2802396 RepID=A0A963YUW6_9PROT|nr:UdgX family uracil-DNA binding protein [Acidisoma silvae]MCB8877194.1 UdgX family uracil-DNA binding protein [Acidisoma silvae]
METILLQGRGDFAEWRAAARNLLSRRIAPDEVVWSTIDAGSLFAPTPAAPVTAGPAALVPKTFVDLAETVICHTEPGRFALLYRVLLRLQTERALLGIPADADIAALHRLEKSVRRDCHKMTAFVRFREVPEAEPAARRRFVAWFEPDHFILPRIAPFFARRFADMDWMILTPKGSIGFADGNVTLSDEPTRKPALDDPADQLWLTYYASIFNPARLKVRAMQSEMPKKYWKNLPEAALIPSLIAEAPARVAAMAAQQMQAPPAFHARLQQRRQEDAPPPPVGGLAGLRQEAAGCTRCALHCQATQTVFGEGPERAAIMIVGEQPGDQEDLAGRPFVGPAGQVFDTVAAEVGLDRAAAYVTNAVKHFKFEPRGKRRIHQKPDAGEIQACRWWLTRELDLVSPRLVVAMGKTALFALTGKDGRLADQRGRIMDWQAGRSLLVTVHPSYLLRLPDRRQQAEETARFRDDLALARRWREDAAG